MRLRLARAVSRIVPPHEVEDIVQETYVRLCQVGKTERIQHPKSYLLRTARNLALDSVKRAENRRAQSLEDTPETRLFAPRGGTDEVLEEVASREEVWSLL